jgi:DNA-directed RNA polymerase specialized sigma24 family protein
MGQDFIWNWNKDLTAQLTSTDIKVRNVGWDMLYGEIYTELENYFYRCQRTGYTGLYRQHYASDLTHILWEKMHKRLSSEKPLEDDSVIERYIKTVAYKLVIEEGRGHAREPGFVDFDDIHSELPLIEVEDKNVIEWRENATLLCSHLKTDWERYYAHLVILGLKPEEIHAVTGEGLNGVYNATKRIRRKITKMATELDYYEKIPSPWDNRLAFIGDSGGSLIVNLVNARPQRLDPESCQTLLKDLNVRTMDEVFDSFLVLAQIEDINPSNPQARILLSFTPRNSLSEALYLGKPVDYVNYVPVFDVTKKNGGREQRLHLTQKFESSAYVHEQRVYDDQGEPIGWEWLSTDFQTTALKAYNPRIFHFCANPRSQRQTINLMRAYSRTNVPAISQLSC